jgi:hypothetical protein
MPTEKTIGANRPGRKPTWRCALLWAVAGAALFLGVDGSRRVWVPYGVPPGANYPPTTLWEMAYTAFSSNGRLVGSSGLPVREVYTFSVAVGSFGLLVHGATAGLLGYLALSWLRQRKGGAE